MWLNLYKPQTKRIRYLYGMDLLSLLVVFIGLCKFVHCKLDLYVHMVLLAMDERNIHKPYIDISNAHFMVHLKRIHVDEINKNSFIVLIPF